MLIFLYLFVYLYIKKKFIVCSFFLALAIAMKAFPAVFLVLFLGDKRYKEVFITIAIVIVLTLSSLMFFKEGFLANFNFMFSGFNYSNYPQLCHNNNIVQRGTSLFTLAKIYLIQSGQILSVNMPKFFGGYAKVVIASFFFLAAYVMFIEKELWKKVMILVAVALLFPHVSSDYKLIYLFIPMFLFINSERKSSFDFFYIAVFGLLLIPKDYYIFPKILSDSGYIDISMAIVLNILFLIGMIGMIMTEGLLKLRCWGGRPCNVKK
jgi:hypothetical protein